jgi:hypothetical protein
VIAKNTVLPVAITSDLNTASSHVGDKFTAKLLTHGTERFEGLPFGTVVYGTVKYIKRLEGESAGLMELAFEGVETPSGQRFPISGQLYDLDRTKKHPITNASEPAEWSFWRVLFAGYGSNSRRIVGVIEKAAKDSDLPKLVAKEVPVAVRTSFTDEVQLPEDSQFGVRLLEPLKVPKDVMLALKLR